MSLAVLHPRKLVVYIVHAVGSSYLQLQRAYEHLLQHSAANMTIGPFGGTKGGSSNSTRLFALISISSRTSASFQKCCQNVCAVSR